ncbi:MAG: HigA family addiction module antidote protein [Chloroflexi bacterium]|nr:HigA family addiction module antidote protein [Chloroflexota bacterium]
MIKQLQNQFIPDYATPPGDTLLETIQALGMNQAELAKRTGRPLKTVNEIIKGKVAITPETALQLERVLGVPAGFWNNLERNYRESLARLDEQERLQKQLAWLKQIPVKAIAKLEWFAAFDDPVQQFQAVLRFFGVASPDQWENLWGKPAAAYRQSRAFQSDPGAVAAWLRKGELDAQQIPCQAYDAAKFQAALSHARALTTAAPEEFCPALTRMCANAGVAVVFVPELPKVRVSGVTRWLSPDKALIQLSLFYKRDDQLWFTFFHEAGHIVLHGKRDVFLEEDTLTDDKENQANDFAANLLISPADWERFIQAGSYRTKTAIQEFADEVGIAPGIVVGRLQHDGHLPHSHCNDLKRRLVWI